MQQIIELKDIRRFTDAFFFGTVLLLFLILKEFLALFVANYLMLHSNILVYVTDEVQMLLDTQMLLNSLYLHICHTGCHMGDG